LENDALFARLCAALGHPEWSTDDRFATNAGRLQNRAEIDWPIGEIGLGGLPLSFDGRRPPPLHAARDIGEDNDQLPEVLKVRPLREVRGPCCDRTTMPNFRPDEQKHAEA
jgi:hypothetical protein